MKHKKIPAYHVRSMSDHRFGKPGRIVLEKRQSEWIENEYYFAQPITLEVPERYSVAESMGSPLLNLWDEKGNHVEICADLHSDGQTITIYAAGQKVFTGRGA